MRSLYIFIRYFFCNILIFMFISLHAQVLPFEPPKKKPDIILDPHPPPPPLRKIRQGDGTSSQPPEYISGNMQLAMGQSTTLKVQGGRLSSGWKWVWYRGKCGGAKIGEGVQITIAPDWSGYYYVRGEGGKNQATACAPAAYVQVDNKSRAPNKIIGPDKICSNRYSEVTLAVEGGQLGADAAWVWYEGNCGEKKIGYGKKIKVQPSKSTSYFVRAEGPSNFTDCARLYIELIGISSAPISIYAPNAACSNEDVQMEVKGGSLADDASWVWYKEDILPENKIGTGSKITIRSGERSQYLVRAEGLCNVTKEAKCIINIKKESAPPSLISSRSAGDKPNEYNLSVYGGDLGDEAKWVWYKKKCGGKKIGEGDNISFKVSQKQTIFVRAEGACNVTDCKFIELKPENRSSVSLINLGVVTSGGFVRNPNLSLMVAGKNFYGRAKFSISRLLHRNASSIPYEVSDNYLVNYPFNSGNYYTFNGRQFNKRTSLTFGYISPAQQLRYYFGLGYGSNQQIWGVDLNNINNGSVSYQTWAKYSDYSLSGIETEAGLIMNYKKINFLWGFNLLYGISRGRRTFFIDTNIGIGLNFNGKK